MRVAYAFRNLPCGLLAVNVQHAKRTVYKARQSCIFLYPCLLILQLLLLLMMMMMMSLLLILSIFCSSALALASRQGQLNVFIYIEFCRFKQTVAMQRSAIVIICRLSSVCL